MIPHSRLERAPELDLHSPPRTAMVGLAKIGLVLRQNAWQERNHSGLTPTQGQILATLRARSPEAASLSELARDQGVSLATTSDAVATLVAKHLVIKEMASDDRRRASIALTDAGHRAAELSGHWPDFLIQAVDALDPQEQAVFLRGLVKMIRSLQGSGRIPIARMCTSCSFFRPNVHADPNRPHHCAFADSPFGDRELRLDCADHQSVSPPQADLIWASFDSVDSTAKEGT